MRDQRLRPVRAKGEAEALWYVGPGRAEIRAEALPPLGPDDVEVRTLHSALSRGTEALVAAGRVPQSEFERMRAPGMGGAFPFPVKYGYAAVGRVERGPPALAGRTVFALHPHQSAFVVAADEVLPLPDDVPPARAVLAANMETALNAVWDAAPGPADRIAVVGAGVVGSLVAYLCGALRGAEVFLVDIAPERARIAQALGVHFALPEACPEACDVVFHASGVGAGLATALCLAGPEASVVELSWYGVGEIPVALGGSFHSQRLRLIASQVGQVAPSHRPRWPHARRLAAALALLADPRLDVLMTPPMAFQDLPHRLAQILAPQSGVLCQRIDYPAANE